MEETWTWSQYNLEVEAVLDDSWHWEAQPPGSISLPDFIRKRAAGEAQMKDGVVYLKKPGPDPEFQKLLNAQMTKAYESLEKAINKSLYEGNQALAGSDGLGKLLRGDK